SLILTFCSGLQALAFWTIPLEILICKKYDTIKIWFSNAP
ncbi:DUF5360 family protein, partial [Bacillus sp. WL1]|nr:DUF5360 family protein [Bacillus sp. WL1]